MKTETKGLYSDMVSLPGGQVGSCCRFMDYVSLTKPEVTFLVLIAAALGSVMAGPTVNLLLLCNVLLGTALVAGGTATLNHYLERSHDAKMRRTANRPLPAGRLVPSQVLWFGLTISLAGTVHLAIVVNGLTSLIGLATLSSYLCVYTPLKRKTTLCTLIGAFPGAAPVLMGWSAVRGTLSVEAWALYALLFVWQFPHFLSIAWMYREDYARAGMLMLPANDIYGDLTFRRILGYSAVLVPVSALPRVLGMTGNAYLLSALLFGISLLYCAYRASQVRSKVNAKHLLHATVVYLPLVYLIMVLDKGIL